MGLITESILSALLEYTWCLADWLEEIHLPSAFLFLSFHHVVRGSNSVADTLSRAGASRTELEFDV